MTATNIKTLTPKARVKLDRKLDGVAYDISNALAKIFTQTTGYYLSGWDRKDPANPVVTASPTEATSQQHPEAPDVLFALDALEDTFKAAPEDILVIRALMQAEALILEASSSLRPKQ